MATTETRLMPLVPNPRRKSDGLQYTDEDREATTVIGPDGVSQTVQRVPYFELVSNGGVRRYEFAPFPAMVYRGKADALGKVQLDQDIAHGEAHLRELQADGWHTKQEAALEAYEQRQRDVARAAAETAASAQTMSEPARREHRKKSADSPDHITE